MPIPELRYQAPAHLLRRPCPSDRAAASLDAAGGSAQRAEGPLLFLLISRPCHASERISGQPIQKSARTSHKEHHLLEILARAPRVSRNATMPFVLF